ncbi:MAG: DUF2007 domain-containing protein [Natronospirillum sp.]
MITIRRYFDTLEAELARGRLEAEGIAASVTNGALQNISHAMVEVNLQVLEDDLQRAEKLLQELESGAVDLGDYLPFDEA